MTVWRGDAAAYGQTVFIARQQAGQHRTVRARSDVYDCLGLIVKLSVLDPPRHGSIVMSASYMSVSYVYICLVCLLLSVCRDSVHTDICGITWPIFTECLWVLPMAVARSSSGGADGSTGPRAQLDQSEQIYFAIQSTSLARTSPVRTNLYATTAASTVVCHSLLWRLSYTVWLKSAGRSRLNSYYLWFDFEYRCAYYFTY